MYLILILQTLFQTAQHLNTYEKREGSGSVPLTKRDYTSVISDYPQIVLDTTRHWTVDNSQFNNYQSEQIEIFHGYTRR